MKHGKWLVLLGLLISGCVSENYSNGERIGMVTQFSRAGIIWKSWEGHLNLTQTGMNSASSEPFNFSIDNNNEDPKVIATIDSAANLGWKIKLTYHETFNKNWFHNRGETDHFVTKVDVLDRTPMASIRGTTAVAPNAVGGRVIDTVFVVILRKASDDKK